MHLTKYKTKGIGMFTESHFGLKSNSKSAERLAVEVPMGMLTRYQRQGGFMQLLVLIEACDSVKQEKFLKMIENEDIRWAKAIRDKMLSVEKILEWSDQQLAELAQQIPENVMAPFTEKMGPQVRDQFLRAVPEAKRRELYQAFEGYHSSKTELKLASTLFIEQVRKLISEGYVYIDRVDPTLSVSPEIEELLASGEVPDSHSLKQETEEPTCDMSLVSVTDDDDIKKKYYELVEENKKLKEENQLLQGKLQQIRKIA